MKVVVDVFLVGFSIMLFWYCNVQRGIIGKFHSFWLWCEIVWYSRNCQLCTSNWRSLSTNMFGCNLSNATGMWLELESSNAEHQSWIIVRIVRRASVILWFPRYANWCLFSMSWTLVFIFVSMSCLAGFSHDTAGEWYNIFCGFRDLFQWFDVSVLSQWQLFLDL